MKPSVPQHSSLKLRGQEGRAAEAMVPAPALGGPHRWKPVRVPLPHMSVLRGFCSHPALPWINSPPDISSESQGQPDSILWCPHYASYFISSRNCDTTHKKKGEYSMRSRERNRPGSHNLYSSILLTLLHCIISCCCSPLPVPNL